MQITMPTSTELMEWLRLLFVLAGGAAVGYGFNRRRLSDKLGDKIASAEVVANISMIETLSDQLQTERNNNEKLGKTVDRLSKERNDAVESAGQLRGKVEALEFEVHRLRNDLAEYAAENRELHAHILHMEKLAEQVGINMAAQKAALDVVLEALKQRQCYGECEDCPSPAGA